MSSLSLTVVRVYPRVGGGTYPRSKLDPDVEGLSPRGRGNRLSRRSDLVEMRSIPAWAGEPCPLRHMCSF